jgi:DNA-binding NarL/FixJ family response regulator
MAAPVSIMVLPTSLSSSASSIGDSFPNSALSTRERDVLLLVAEGCRDQEIAARLFLSHHTVANHVRNILGKLGVSSRAAAVAHAVRNGLL